MNRFYKVTGGDVVASALTAYDLPDLAASLASRPLTVIDLQDQQLQSAADDQVQTQWHIVRQAYQQADADNRLVIQRADAVEDMQDFLPSTGENR